MLLEIHIEQVFFFLWNQTMYMQIASELADRMDTLFLANEFMVHLHLER